MRQAEHDDSNRGDMMTVPGAHIHPFRYPKLKWPGTSRAHVIKRALWYFALIFLFEVLGAGFFPVLASVFSSTVDFNAPFSVASLVKPSDIVILCVALAFTRIPDLLEHLFEHRAEKGAQDSSHLVLLALFIVGVAGSLMAGTDKAFLERYPVEERPDALHWISAVFLVLTTTLCIAYVCSIRAVSEVHSGEAHENKERQQPDPVGSPSNTQRADGVIARQPVYKQLAAILQRDIDAGQIQNKLPSQLVLTQRYRVSRGTARRAVMILVEANYVRIDPGRGTLVIPLSERLA
jgi:hypothetical protein